MLTFDNDTISVNEKGQLVASGATNFNVATKDGGNQVAKKGGSSTTKITAGKTITYTAGKNIAIEQNGGDILVSTTEDVDHNSVTTNNLTVKEGGNVTVGPNSTVNMGGNQVHNVKAGTADTDAVNVSQLRSNVTNLNNRINKVGKKLAAVSLVRTQLLVYHKFTSQVNQWLPLLQVLSKVKAL